MNNKIITIFIFGIIILGILPACLVSAGDDLSYTVLAPLPGIGDAAGKTTLAVYIPALFKLAIGISAVFAVLMIVIGGFQYISTDAIMGKSAGKERIKNAVFGLVLVISAWLILYTINPNLLTFNLNIGPGTATNSEVGTLGGGGLPTGALPGYTLTDAQVAQNQVVKDELWNSNTVNRISVNANPCKNGETRGCTNLVGLPDNAINGVKQLNKDCNCSLMITGGAEGGHQTHGPNRAAMDLGPSDKLTTFLQKNGNTNQNYGTEVTLTNNQKATFVWEGAGTEGSSGPHWHVIFK